MTGGRTRVNPGAGPTRAGERSLAPDLARGCVLLFIALANVPSYYYGRPLNVALRPVENRSTLDRTLDFLVSLLVDQRSYPMFAVLVGYGIATVVMRNAAAGKPPEIATRLLRRRALGLGIIGLLHAALLYAGDILGAYAILSLYTLLLVPARTRDVARLAVVFLAPLALWFTLSRIPQGSDGLVDADSYGWSIVVRLSSWLIVTLVMGGLAGMLAPFLIGVVVARTGLVDRPWDHRRALTRTAAAGLAVGVLGGVPYALLVAGWWQPAPQPAVLAGGLHAISGVAMGLAYVCLFALAAAMLRGRPRPRVLLPLTATGQRSLTSYVLQSLALAPLMSAWGLGWGAELSSAQGYALAVVVWSATVAVATALAAASRRGPLEVLLRRWTYGPSPSPGAPSAPVVRTRTRW